MHALAVARGVLFVASDSGRVRAWAAPECCDRGYLDVGRGRVQALAACGHTLVTSHGRGHNVRVWTVRAAATSEPHVRAKKAATLPANGRLSVLCFGKKRPPHHHRDTVSCLVLHAAAGLPVAPWSREHIGVSYPAGLPVAPWGAELVGVNYAGLLHAAGLPVVPWGIGRCSFHHPGLLYGAIAPIAPWGAGTISTHYPNVPHGVVSPVAPWAVERVPVHRPEFLHCVGGNGARMRVGDSASI